METIENYKNLNAKQLTNVVACLRELCLYSINQGDYAKLAKYAAELEYADYLYNAKFVKVCG